jgi:hypothetical protein
MKRFILLFTGMVFAISLYPQERKLNQKIADPKSGGEIMIGYCTLAGIADTGFNSAFRKEYDAYTPDKEITSQIPTLLEGVTVTIIMGTWCSDSREQVPRFMKLFDHTGQSTSFITLICVDRDKKAGDVSLEGLDLLKVPTFIVYFNGRELGRIIETPQTTLEKDFLDILRKKL